MAIVAWISFRKHSTKVTEFIDHDHHRKSTIHFSNTSSLGDLRGLFSDSDMTPERVANRIFLLFSVNYETELRGYYRDGLEFYDELEKAAQQVEPGAVG